MTFSCGSNILISRHLRRILLFRVGIVFFPHIFVWGSCFWLCTPVRFLPRPTPASSSRRPSTYPHTTYSHTHTTYSHTTYSHTTYPHTTYTQLTHAPLTHTPLTHTPLTHTPLTHTPLTHTPLAHTPLTHTPLTHNLLTHHLPTHHLHTTYSHTHLPTHHLPTHHLLTHHLPTRHLLTHNLLTHHLPTPLTHTPLTHTHTHHLPTHHLLTYHLPTHHLLTHHLPTHHLPHTTYSHTTYPHTTYSHTTYPHTTYTQLTHTPLTHTPLTHTPLPLTHTPLTHTHTTYSHTTCPHTTYSHTTYSHTTYSHTTYPHTTYTQLTHTPLTHTPLTHTPLPLTHTPLTHTHTTYSHTTYPHTTYPFGAEAAAVVCVAGVAIGDIDLRFAWQAWHLVTSTVTLRGRRGTYGTGLALVTRLGRVWRRGRGGRLRGRRGTWWHWPSLCVAGVALGDIDRHFAWQAWHVWHWAGSGDALGSRMALWSPRSFAWQVWHLVTLTFTSLCVAGVALGDIDRHFAWQAWHVLHWAGLVVRFGPVWGRGRRGRLRGRCGTWWPLTFALRGRRGAWWHWPSLCVALGWLWWRAWVPFGAVVAAVVCVAGVALGDIDLPFAWQAWHLVTSTVTLRGRRGTYFTRLTLMRAWVPFGAVVAAAVCVAGVAIGDFALQVWWRLVTSTVTLRGRRGTYGTGLALVTRLGLLGRPWHTHLCHTPSFTHLFADSHLGFAWQAWHLWHWAGSILSTDLTTCNLDCFLAHGQLCSQNTFNFQMLPKSAHTQFFIHHLSSHISFTHNFHIQLSNSNCSILHHLSHTIFPTHTHNFATHHLSHTTLVHTTLHIQPSTHRSSTTSLVYPAFPVPLQLCVLIIGRSWLVGLSGPL